jgi:hypothetical protein
MTHTRRLLAALAALALSVPSAARAQGCVGAAVPDRHYAFQLETGFANYDVGPAVDGKGLGASFRGNPGGPLAFSAEYMLNAVGEADARLHTGGVNVAFRPPLAIPLLAVCARAGATGALFSDGPSGSELTNWTFPLGVVLELPLPMANGNALVPYVAPQYLISSTSGEVFGFDLSESGNGFGFEGGVGLRLRRAVVTFGGTFSDLPEELVTTAFPRRSLFVRAGVLF